MPKTRYKWPLSITTESGKDKTVTKDTLGVYSSLKRAKRTLRQLTKGLIENNASFRLISDEPTQVIIALPDGGRSILRVQRYREDELEKTPESKGADIVLAENQKEEEPW